MSRRPAFSLDLEPPRAGWLRGAMTIGTDRHELLGSWLGDTPRELVDAACAVLQSRPASVVWIEEPGASTWQLEPGQRNLGLTIVPSDRLGSSGSTADGGEDYQVAAARFGRAVLSAMTDLIDRTGEQRYVSTDGWGHPFPNDAVARLRDLVRRQHVTVTPVLDRRTR